MRTLPARAARLAVAGVTIACLSACARPALPDEIADQATRAAAADGPPELITIRPGAGSLIVQNLDAARPVTASIELHSLEDGSRASIAVDAIAPGAMRRLDLAERAELPLGVFSAVVRSIAPVGVLARTEWPSSGGLADWADMANAAEPAMDLVLPVVAKRHEGATSVIVLQNSDGAAPASVGLDFRPMGSASSAWRGEVGIEPGASALLDLAGARFRDLPSGFFGQLRITSSVPLAVRTLMRVEASKAFAAYNGIPVAEAERHMYAGFRTPFLSPRHSTALVITNPGTAPARVQVTYHGDVGTTCEGRTFFHPEVTVEAGTSGIISQAPGGGSGLPENCAGSSVIAASEPMLATVYDADLAEYPPQLLGIGSAFHLRSAATRQGLPWVVSRGDASTALVVHNIGDGPASVSLQLVDRQGQRVPACGGACVANLAPLRSQVWWWNLNLPQGLEGSAVISATRPVLAYGSEIAKGRGSNYVGIPVPGHPGPHFVPFLARIEAIPTPTPWIAVTETPAPGFPPAPTPPAVLPEPAPRFALSFGSPDETGDGSPAQPFPTT